MLPRSRGEKVFNVVNVLLLLVLAAVTMYPFLYTLSISLSSAAEARRSGLHVLPGDASLLGRGLKDAAGLGPGSQLVGTQDVLDWSAFLDRLRSPVRAGQPSPEGQVYHRLSDRARSLLQAARDERSAEQDAPSEALSDLDRGPWPDMTTREAICDELERIAGDPNLCDPAAWAGVELDEDLSALLGKHAAGSLAAEDVARLNRRLLESAFAYELRFTEAGQIARRPFVSDWQGLVDRLLTPRKAVVPSVDRRILTLLSPATREGVLACDGEGNQPLQQAVLAEMQAMLADPNFYRAEAWAQTRLSDQTREMVARLDRSELGGDDLLFLNRELLGAAYPTLIARHLRGMAFLREYAKGFSTASYVKVLTNPDIGIGYLNTVLRTILGTLATLFMTCLAAYPLSRPDMPYRRGLTIFILFTMLFSGGLVPTYMLIRSVGLIDNFLVYILPGMLGAFNIIIVRNFFRSIPEDMGEAARIDGAGEFSILMRIYVPLSKPVLATVALWTAVGQWNMWFDTMIYTHSSRLQTLQSVLRRIVIEGNVELIEKGLVRADVAMFTPETIKAATVIVTILPILLFYPLIQRYFVKGIMVGSIKG